MTDFSSSILTATEIRYHVQEIWKIVLEVPSVDLDDNFFSLGGNSLKAIEAIAGVEALLGVSIDPVEVLEYPVLKDFVEFLVRFAEDRASVGLISEDTQDPPLN